MSINAQSDNLSLAYYCQRVSALNVNKTKQRGKALNKPILLLSVIDLIAQGIIKENKIYVEDQLIKTFNKYWEIIAGDSSSAESFSYPFIHLQNDGFWQIKFSSNFMFDGMKISSIGKLKKAVNYATLDDSLFLLLQNPDSCQVLIDNLVAKWFEEAKKDINFVINLNQSFDNKQGNEENLNSTNESQKQEPQWIIKKSVIRNAFFRKSIVHIYDYRCAVCGLKVNRKINQNIVDGAHIKPFSLFYDCGINNGICLCKNHHWGFDMGWFTIDDDYKVIVAADLHEESPNAKRLVEFHRASIILPNVEKYLPSFDSLKWHRQHVFFLS